MSNTRSKLDAMAVIHGTDKSSRAHDYARWYERELSDIRHSVKTLLEIGVAGGCSIRMWRDWFPEARIVGVDSNPACAFSEPRVSIVIGDQAQSATISSAIAATKSKTVDVAIDDGGHTAKQQTTTFSMLWPSVSPGGCYVIEDLHTSYWPSYGGNAGEPGTGVGLVKELSDCCNNFGWWEYATSPGASPRANARLPQRFHDVERVALYRSLAFIWKTGCLK